MLELQKGSKNLFDVLELLRTAPEDHVAAILESLRSSDSVSQFLQSVDPRMVTTSWLLNPLAVSFTGTSVSLRIELDLNMRYSSAFPSLETLKVTDMDLDLLAANKRNLALLNSQATLSSSLYSQTNFSSRSFTTTTTTTTAAETTPESFSTPRDTIGDATQHLYQRLEHVKIWQWTSVPIPDTLAVKAISFYLINEHPLVAFLEADLFVRDLVSGTGRFCSPLLVSSLLAWSCVSYRSPSLDLDFSNDMKASYSQFEPSAQALSFAFFKEAKLRWGDLEDYNNISTISSAMFLVLTCNQQGQDRAGLFDLDASAEIGYHLGLFGDKGITMSDLDDDDDEIRTAASFAAWGSFGWHR
jgi:hypothetical protein